ncbi:hypothetical protein LCGC14_2588390 [marine sediment metagenome]|uniref:PIN domain-containing protein n=1 Tax=marine sediment metagenome TaxID=412755 RepID=A0A0F9B0B6_9ZZZZ
MIIADTTVLIDVWRGRAGIKSYLERYKEKNLCISAITVAEIYDGLGYTKEKKGEAIYTKIRGQIGKIISEFHIIPINTSILQESGTFKGVLRAKNLSIWALYRLLK